MLGVPFLCGRSRACLLRAPGPVIGSIFVFLAQGCATTAGSASYESARTQYDHSASPGAAARPNDGVDGLRASTLERRAYIRAVLAQNPTIESARQGWRAALSRVRQSGSFDDPMVELGVAPLSIGSSKAPLGYEVGISQRLPWFGKRGFEALAASAEADASKSDYEAMKRELALSALLLYDQYFVAERAIEINHHHVELMRVMRDGATVQFQAGRGSAQDPLQAEAELAHMEHDTAILASQRDVIIAQMNELLHRSPEQPLPPPPQELPMPAVPSSSETEHLEASALANRSEISAARQRAEAAQARADRADREYYPDLTVSTSYNSMWDMPEHRWMVGLGFNLPIQAEHRAGAADEARAMRAEFESDAAHLSDAARTQVFVALKQLQESEHVLGLFEKRLLPVARDQIDAARAGFIASQNPFLAVVEAEKNLRGIELDYQMARVECDRHRAELDRALGRIPGLETEQDKP
ncbi:MAG TPA: TolC family protein [Polyangiaceae bacterium]|nr:TolC family protein [Polyangiaceae bacterium]